MTKSLSALMGNVLLKYSIEPIFLTSLLMINMGMLKEEHWRHLNTFINKKYKNCQVTEEEAATEEEGRSAILLC